MITDEQRNFISILVNSNQNVSDQVDLISRLVNTMVEQGTIARDKDTVIEMVSQMLFKVADDHYNMGYKLGYSNGDKDGQSVAKVNAWPDVQRAIDESWQEGFEKGNDTGHGIGYKLGYDNGWADASNQPRKDVNILTGEDVNQDGAPF